MFSVPATARGQTLLMATYGGGLRVSEVVRLRVSDIDAQRGMIRVEQGKGRKDRYTIGILPIERVWQGDPSQPATEIGLMLLSHLVQMGVQRGRIRGLGA